MDCALTSVSREEKKFPLQEINSHLYFFQNGFRMGMCGVLQKEDILFGHSISATYSIGSLLSVSG